MTDAFYSSSSLWPLPHRSPAARQNQIELLEKQLEIAKKMTAGEPMLTAPPPAAVVAPPPAVVEPPAPMVEAPKLPELPKIELPKLELPPPAHLRQLLEGLGGASRVRDLLRLAFLFLLRTGRVRRGGLRSVVGRKLKWWKALRVFVRVKQARVDKSLGVVGSAEQTSRALTFAAASKSPSSSSLHPSNILSKNGTKIERRRLASSSTT